MARRAHQPALPEGIHSLTYGRFLTRGGTYAGARIGAPERIRDSQTRSVPSWYTCHPPSTRMLANQPPARPAKEPKPRQTTAAMRIILAQNLSSRSAPASTTVFADAAYFEIYTCAGMRCATSRNGSSPCFAESWNVPNFATSLRLPVSWIASFCLLRMPG